VDASGAVDADRPALTAGQDRGRCYDRRVEPEAPSQGASVEFCYRHPSNETGVHCTRCGRPICTDCMTPAPVGYQCPECVAEARQTAPRPRMRVRFFLGRPGSITTTLLMVNIAMFVVEVVVGGSGSLFSGPNNQKLFDLGALFPPAIAQTGVIPEHHQYWRLITPMFLHAGLIHLAFNSYALYLLGF